MKNNQNPVDIFFHLNSFILLKFSLKFLHFEIQNFQKTDGEKTKT